MRLTNEQKIAICHYNKKQNELSSYKNISKYIQDIYGVKPCKSITYTVLDMYENHDLALIFINPMLSNTNLYNQSLIFSCFSGFKW